jgi:hypothetical protein
VNAPPSNAELLKRRLSSQGCLVPRLMLLFFGEAKDVPEAARMVTAGIACAKLQKCGTWLCFKPRFDDL